MRKKLFSLIATFSLLSVGLATLNVAPANAVTVTVSLDCADLSILTTSNGWETVTGSGQNYVESSGKQKRLVMNPNDDYTFTFSNCNFYRAVTPANNLTPGSLQLTPNPSNAGTVTSSSWAYGGSSLTQLGVLGGATLPTMPINGANRNYLMATSGSSINVVNPIVIIFIDPDTSANANLSSLMLRDNSFNTINLSPSFSANTTSYTATTTASRVAMSASPAQFNTPVLGTCRGTALANPGLNCDISSGSNTLTLTVTAPDGTTTKVYTITVTKTDPVAPTIATTSTISNSQTNPTVVVTSAATALTSNPAFWSISTGTTGLIRSSSSSTGGTVTFGFTGTATCGGTLTLRANAAAFFSPTETLNSNTLSIVIPAGNCSSDGTLSTSSTVKGATISSLGTPGTGPGDVTRGSVTISPTQAADTSNTGSFVTSFIKNNANAIVLSTRKAPTGTLLSSVNFSFNYNGTSAINDGDFFVVIVLSQDSSSYNYYVIDVIVGVSNSSSSLMFAAASAFEGGFSVQISNYDEAFTYTATTTAGSLSINPAGLISVFSLRPNQAATVNVTRTRSGYLTESGTVTSSSQVTPLITILALADFPTINIINNQLIYNTGNFVTPTGIVSSLYVNNVYISSIASGDLIPWWLINGANSTSIIYNQMLNLKNINFNIDQYDNQNIRIETVAYKDNAIAIISSNILIHKILNNKKGNNDSIIDNSSITI